MAALTDDGVATRERVRRYLGPMWDLIPEDIVSYTDWDAMSRSGGVPWEDERMQSHVPIDELNRMWDEYRDERLTEARGGVVLEVEREQRELDEHTQLSGIPDRYRNVPLDLTYIDDINSGKNVYIYGRQGSGKTFRACSMLRGWMSRNRKRGLFVTSVKLLSEITATYGNTSTVLEVVDRYGRTPLLVIDDLGKESPTEHTLEMLWYVINTRYEWKLPTIFTAQYTLSELAARLGERGNSETSSSIVSRIREWSVGVNAGDVDRRLSNAF